MTEALVFCSSADAAAARNWAANLRALASTQGNDALSCDVQRLQRLAAGVTWIYARDGSLSAQHPDGRWLGGCSLPLRAARAMFYSLKAAGVTACFLSPSHGAQVAAALERLSPEQVLVVVVPDISTLRLMLACSDFSADIAARRLWFVSGNDWAADLDRLFDQHPGLPTPAQFVRTPMLKEEQLNELIEPAKAVFARHNASRSAKVNELIHRALPGSHRSICVIAPSRFELWNDAGSTLADALAQQAHGKVAMRRFDPSHGAGASPLALATVIADCGAVVSANLARADVPEVASPKTPWITWVTMPRIPRPTKQAPNDRIILADVRWRQAALREGWSEAHIHVGGWPAIEPVGESAMMISLIADTHPMLAPPNSESMPLSSHRLMWEYIQAELSANPLAIGDDADAYLSRCMQRFSISEHGLDRERFVDRLIVPAYQQGIADLLLAEGLPLRIFGWGWESIQRFAATHAGVIQSRDELAEVIGKSAVVVHPTGLNRAHPIDGSARPALRPSAKLDRKSYVAQARQWLASSAPPASPQSGSSISLALIQDILSK